MVVVDDVGSFPLPEWMPGEEFERLYSAVLTSLNKDSWSETEDLKIFRGVIAESFEQKVESGIDVVTYPQHYDMHRQFLEPIKLNQEEPFLIKKEKARMPEIEALQSLGKDLSIKKGESLKIKACVTGPIDLYLGTEFGTNIYKDVLINIAQSVNRFLKKSIIDTPHMRTEIVSLDEPSIGFTDLLNIEYDDIIDVWEKTLRGVDASVQMHFHTLKSAYLAFQTEGITTISGEFAASPKTVELVSKKELEEHDKFLRAGITRTNIDSIIAEYLDRGVEPTANMLIDERDIIEKRVKKLYSRFGERISTWGPDCGLGSWPTQKVASELLKRTADAVRESFK